MTPTTRNIALAAAAIALPAALAAAAGPDRMRRLPARVRDVLHDDSVEGQLKRLESRLTDLGDDLDFHSTRSDRMADIGRIAAIAGAVLLVPAALTAWMNRGRIADTARRYRSTGETPGGGFADDLADLEDDIEEQREDAFEAVTGAAQGMRD
ncbi:Trp biosynthesis-associated membrane protein [Palleronia pelagia]|uniref:Tryptophan-associated transmembrane protein (Trp_oprn_chp) n=1 Tax=Palleronia pelagia TaxID=387096 RepID=A0A1H8AW61_9RHOB|nr:Trp biosynthesis-associated membrane protein [Palleronia pelagia]SEM73747.1 Tryptophan-associated transmembrane protein (Trp_oprn_chp) [Palleronia pelagia]